MPLKRIIPSLEEFFTEFAKHPCAIDGKRILGVGVAKARKKGKFPAAT
jgi:hypothetical protein